MLDEPVNLVNAAVVAQSRGLRVLESRSREPEDYVSLITSRVVADGRERTIAGALFGRSEARIVRVEPGMIGRVGSLLGEHSINIAGMHVGRSQSRPGGRSVMVLALDNPIPADTMEQLRQIDGIMTAQLVEL